MALDTPLALAICFTICTSHLCLAVVNYICETHWTSACVKRKILPQWFSEGFFLFLLPSQGFLKIFTLFKVLSFKGVVPVENTKPFEDIYFFKTWILQIKCYLFVDKSVNSKSHVHDAY